MVKAEKGMQVVAMIHEENGYYGVSFADFPGATTVADDLDSAVVKAAEVLAFHVEGLAEDGPLPQVRSLSELRRDPAFREDSKGAVLVLVPYSPPSRAIRLNVTIEESLLERIDRAAQAAGETRSAFLARAAKRLLMGASRGIADDKAPRGPPRQARSGRFAGKGGKQNDRSGRARKRTKQRA
jgi:predicted RNase H-like HicB family nuclease